MNNDYHFVIKSNDKITQFDWVVTDRGKARGTLNGICYSLQIEKEQDRKIIELFLQHVPHHSTPAQLVESLKLLPQLQEVQITTLEKKLAIESGLIPTLPTLGEPLKARNIEQRMQELGVGGASIAVMDKGIIWSSGYGELSTSQPVLIQAASISKSVTALTILSLIDQCEQARQEGRLSGLQGNKIITLDTDVSTLLDKDLWHSIDPDGRTEGMQPKMTIRHLLSHTAGTTVSGFGGYDRVKEIKKEIAELTQDHENLNKHKERLEKLKNVQAMASKGNLPTVDDILKGKGNSDPVKIVGVPGTKFEYSGGGTTILQKVIEVLTQQKFEDVVKERVFKKLGMEHSTYSPEESRTIHGNDRDGSAIPGRWHSYPELAAAGLWTTPTDLAKMAIGIQRSIAGKEDGILSLTLPKEMLTQQTPGEPNGLGVFVEPTLSSTYFFHQGSNLGFRCMFIANSEGQGAVVMTNSEFGDHLYDELIPSIAKVYQWPDRENLPMFKSLFSPEEITAITKGTPGNREKWNEYIGTYQYQDHLVKVSFSNEKIIVEVDEDPPFEVTPLTEKIGTFRLSNFGPPEVIQFKKLKNESVVSLILFNSAHRKI